jgi:hypothetical protein
VATLHAILICDMTCTLQNRCLGCNTCSSKPTPIRYEFLQVQLQFLVASFRSQESLNEKPVQSRHQFDLNFYKCNEFLQVQFFVASFRSQESLNEKPVQSRHQFDLNFYKCNFVASFRSQESLNEKPVQSRHQFDLNFYKCNEFLQV